MHSSPRQRVKRLAQLCAALLALVALTAAAQGIPALDAKRAREIALSTRVNGQVGNSFDLRITSTDRSYNYKLRAIWMTPEVIRANARLLQLTRSLSLAETDALVKEAESVDGAVILIEIDPREGSGVIPRDWQARFGPRSDEKFGGIVGKKAPHLRDAPALASAARRDYSYDQFWVVFPLAGPDGGPLFAEIDEEAELVVQIYNKEGKVRWSIPPSLRRARQPAAR